MKKILFFLLAVLEVASCTKNLDKTLMPSSDIASKSKDNLTRIALDSLKQDSLEMVFLKKYLNYTPLTSYQKDSIAKNEAPKTSISTISGGNPEYSDWSGKIHLKVFWERTYVKGHYQEISASITSEYALVGGGAWAFDYTGNGAFITQSRPDPNNINAWRGRSKDHAVTDLHNLYVYAIGMRIDEVDPAFLRSQIVVVQSNPSPPSDLPTNTINVPWNYLLIGGGAFDDYHGYGNILTRSYPNGFNWEVRGKAHSHSDPSSITAYAIGINNISFPNVGYLRVTVNPITESSGYGETYCYSPVVSGAALTCPGGLVTYNGWGRLLVGLYPSNLIPVAQLISKDAQHHDWGENTAYAVGIEKRPW
jgi:hypothetical protein